MSIQVRGLGAESAATNVANQKITAGAAAAPWVATVTAGHGLKDGDRLGICGITGMDPAAAGQTGPNGDWTMERVTDTTYRAVGSNVAGTFGGTAAVAVLCDRTPFMPGHSGLVLIGVAPGAAVAVATCVIEAADSRDASAFYYTNSSGVATSGFKSALMTGQVALPAGAASGGYAGITRQVKMSRYMKARCSAWTSGGFEAALMA